MWADIDLRNASALEGESRTVKYTPTAKSEYAVECEGKHIGISTPGPTKRLATKDLKELWTEAVKRLKAADVVVCVGYRFPPSDAEARERLFGALRESTRPHVELNIVLGPERDKDVVRLEQLLLNAMSREREDRTRRACASFGRRLARALWADDLESAPDGRIVAQANAEASVIDRAL